MSVLEFLFDSFFYNFHFLAEILTEHNGCNYFKDCVIISRSGTLCICFCYLFLLVFFTWSHFLEGILIFVHRTCICRIVYRNTLRFLIIMSSFREDFFTFATSQLLVALTIQNHFSPISGIGIIWNYTAASPRASLPCFTL